MTPGKVPSVASMVSGLEARLEREPGDGKGWLLLAKSYKHLDRPDDAREAYNRAAALGESDPSLAGELFGLTPVAAQLLEGGESDLGTTQ
jgi:cytochrome c-type biogenesis protein CcmH